MGKLGEYFDTQLIVASAVSILAWEFVIEDMIMPWITKALDKTKA